MIWRAEHAAMGGRNEDEETQVRDRDISKIKVIPGFN
jgi:hypothetical protein